MRLASDNEYRWVGIGGTLIIIGILAWLFMLDGPDETQQALNTKFGVSAEQSPNADIFARDAQAVTN